MDHFRNLIVTALLAGFLAGVVLFVVQHVTIVPLIELAEGFEDAPQLAHPQLAHPQLAHPQSAQPQATLPRSGEPMSATPAPTVPGGHAHGASGTVLQNAPTTSAHTHEHAHGDEGWQPNPGFQRISLTAVTTIISGIGFAAILLAVITLSGTAVDVRRGLLWGLAGFACFALAPALGLPPKPPGAAVGDLHMRQVWWGGTVLATACGLWLIFGPAANRWSRIVGVVVLGFPHVLGVPPPEGADLVPATLMRDFAILSIGTNLLFWLVLGGACGWLLDRGWGRANGATRPNQA